MNNQVCFWSVVCLVLGISMVFAQEEESWSAPVQVGTALGTEEVDAVEFTQPGVVVSRSVAKVVPQVDGEIQKVCFEPGSKVSKGDVLFELDPVRYQAAQMVAEAHVADCQAQLELAQLSFNRQKSLNGANLRFRAVLMTARSFLFGVFPMVIATGAGAGSRRAIGITTFWGMLVATLVGIIFVPPLYSLVQRIREWLWARFLR